MSRKDVVELRVHGVSGTPPEELLDRGEVYRLAGDATAGFYRPRLAEEGTDGTWAPLLPGSQGGPQLEGYAWGGLTSGAPSRALWLLLLPFTMVNVAPRLRPPVAAHFGSRSNPWVWLHWYLSRLLALALTVLLVLAAAGIGDDLIGWQCGQGNRCPKANPQWFARWAFGVPGADGNRGGLSVEHRLAFGTLVPLLVVLALWLISRATINRYETVDAGFDADPDVDVTPEAGDGHSVAGEVRLQSRWMWQNTALVQRLGAVHIQAGLATALWVIAGPLEPSWQISQHSWFIRLPSELYRHPIGLVAALVALHGVVVFAIPSFSRHRASAGWHRFSRVMWTVLIVAWVIVGVRLLLGHHAVHHTYVTSPRAGRAPVSGLPGFSASLLGLFLFEIVALIGLAVVVAVGRWQSGRRPNPLAAGNAPSGLGGFGTIILATMGVFLASVFSAGAYLFSAGWLNTGSLKPSYRDMSMVPQEFHLPEVIKLATLAYTLGVIWVGLVVIGALIWFASAPLLRWHRLVDTAGFDVDYPNLDLADPVVGSRKKEILRAFFYGRIVDLAGNVIVALVAMGAAISAVISAILFGEHVGHWGWAERAAHWLSATRTSTHASLQSSIPSLEIIGAYLTVLTLLLMVSLGGLAFRVQATRRSVGILWDIASFWPRTGHPLAAPCYAERAVPDLMTRIHWYRTGWGQAHGVVLAGHSQGTVISAAALIQLAERAPQAPRGRDGMPAHDDPDGDVLTGLSFLTFGCVLRRLYGRYFPVYFGAPVFDRLARHLGGTDTKPGRWLNLWRYTDYLGGMVTAGPPPTKSPPGVRAASPLAPICEQHLRDPALFAVPAGDTVAGPPLRHSDFWKSPDGSFQQAVGDLAQLVRANGLGNPEHLPAPDPVPEPGPGLDHTSSSQRTAQTVRR